MNQAMPRGATDARSAAATGRARAGAAGDAPGAGGAQRIITGEAVAIDLRVARLGSRLVAGLIDLLAQLYIFYFLAIVVVFAVRPDDDALAAAVFLLVYVTIVLGYPVACETFTRGRTLGKMAMGLRVVRDDGGPIHFRHAFVRGLVGAVVERPGSLLGLPAVISMLVSRNSKRLGDVFAGTVVLQVRVPRTVGATPFVPPALLGWASLLDLSGLDDSLALRARHFLSRAHALSPAALDRMGRGLVDEVRAVVTPAPPPGTPGWAFLSAVLAERTRRAYARLIAQRPPEAPTGPPGGPAAYAGGGFGGPPGGHLGAPPWVSHPPAPMPSRPPVLVPPRPPSPPSW